MIASSDLHGSPGIDWPSGPPKLLCKLLQVLNAVWGALRVQSVMKVCLVVLPLTLTLGCDDPAPRQELSSEVVSSPDVLPDGVRARVLSVMDGITIEVESEGSKYRVRYLGVQVPEESAPGDGGPSVGRRALEFNRFLVLGRFVELWKGRNETGPEGNLLRYVYIDGEMVNKALITNGHATVSAFPSTFEFKSEFVLAQENARANRRGVWEAAKEEGEHQVSPLGTATPPAMFFGGTLPAPPTGGSAVDCDYSGTPDSVIKGNVDQRTGQHVYHVPGSMFYSTTVVDEAQGDRWFCTEVEAIEAGWKRSKR